MVANNNWSIVIINVSGSTAEIFFKIKYIIFNHITSKEDEGLKNLT